MRHRLAAAAAALWILPGATAFAQIQPPPADPTTPARVQLGPVSVRPALILREVGFDSNVFNEARGERGDFTATLGARVEIGLRTPRLRTTYTSFFEYLHFQEFESERGTNRGVEARADVAFGRLRPYVLAGLVSSHDRPNAEIDARAERRQSNVGVGLAATAFSRTLVTVAYTHRAVSYADDELFRGVQLAAELNGDADTVAFAADVELTPLTTVSAHGEHVRERFDFSPDRDANSHRYGVTALLNPLALISGRATIGVRAYRPLSPLVKDYTGLTAAIAVGYALREETRVGLIVDRDLRASFSEQTPYYVSTGARLTFTQQLLSRVDGQLFAGFERIGYEARLDAAAVEELRDTVRTFGAGAGLRVAEGSRLALNIDRTSRSSPVDSRAYSRARIYATLNYGF